MGLFGGSSKVNNTTETNVSVSVDPTIDVDIGTLAAAQKDAAGVLGQALSAGVTGFGDTLAGSFGQGVQGFNSTLQVSSSNIALALAGGALLLAIARR